MQPPLSTVPLAKEETPAPAFRAPDKQETDNGRGWGLGFLRLRTLAPGRLGREPIGSPRGVSTTPSLADTASSRFAINVSSNLCYVVLNAALMVWYIPFLVRHLGVAAYGMIPLANSLVICAAILSSSLDVSITRFLAIDLNQGNTARANRTFNTALALSLAACGVLLVLAGTVTYFFPVLFNVPSGLEPATQFLFAGMGITTLAAILSGTFGVASLITHRFDLRNVIRALTSLSRIGVVALCFTFWPASLWHVAIGFIISACIGLIGDVMVWKRLTPQLHIDHRDIDSSQFRALLGLSGWSAINQVGLLLLLQVDLLIVNVLFGAESTGLYGSVLLLPALVLMMTETVVAVLSPAIMARYAVGDIAGMQRLASCSVKLLGVGLALPIGLLCGFGRPLLHLWLGPQFAQLDFLLILLVGHLTVNLAVRPLAYVLTAYNRVKAQGLVTLALGVGNVGLAIALARWSGWGMVGVAAAAAIVWTIKNPVFLSSYSAVVMRQRWWTFHAPLIAGALGTLGVAVAGRFASQFWSQTDWLTLGATATGISAAYAVTAYVICLNRSDRDLLRSFLHRRSHG
jgi:membrane protein EpsK